MSDILRSWRVRCQHGQYIKIVTVTSYDDLEHDTIIAKAKRIFFHDFGPSLSMAYESWKILSHEE